MGRFDGSELGVRRKEEWSKESFGKIEMVSFACCFSLFPQISTRLSLSFVVVLGKSTRISTFKTLRLFGVDFGD